MKRTHIPLATHRTAQPRKQPVCFEFTDPSATAVQVAGTFNNWKPEAQPMRCLGDGFWRADTALAPGSYEYCLVLDGKYIADPRAWETVPNPFGGKNSVLTVADSPDMTHLANAEHSPLESAETK